MSLEDRSQRLKFLLSKVELESSKFEDIRTKLVKQKEELKKDVENAGMPEVGISFSSNNQENILEFVSSHKLELDNLKNYISNELDKTNKKIRLLADLNKKYGDKVKIEESQLGGFKIKYNDEDIDNISQTTNLSKKLIQGLKEATFGKNDDKN